MAYHYKESGLDNVYLVNGFTFHETPYGKGVAIDNVEALNRAIGQWLIAYPAPLRGAELRFLRLEMEFTQRNLAAILGTTEQTLRLWEKKRRAAMPGPADRLLRALYSEYTGGGSVRALVERLAELNEIAPATACMRESKHGWGVDQDGELACA